MTAASAVAWLVVALLVVLFAGIVARKRWSPVSFIVYIVLCCGYDLGVRVWPELYTRHAWTAKEMMLTVALFGTALEIARAIYSGYPRASLAIRSTVGVIAVMTLIALVTLRSRRSWIQDDRDGVELILDAQPIIEIGLLYTLLALVLIGTWYRLYIAPWHFWIVIGSVLFLAVNAAVYFSRPDVAFIAPAAFAASAGLWSVAAWRRT